MRGTLLSLVLACAGCSSDDAQAIDAGAIDAPVTIDTLPIDAQACFGTLTRVCLPSAPTGTVILAGTLDTATDPRCTVIEDPTAGFLCVIAGGNLSIEATQVTGSRPLVLVASGSITLEDAIDAGSRRTPLKLGPGARALPCAASQVGLDGSGTAGGGGAGGSFGSPGGAGGKSAGATPTLGGTPNPVVTVSSLRAGCSGGTGGGGSSTGSGTAGASGGAIALYAGSQIAIPATGAVYASGGGGWGAGGGGGGGSGGLIVLEAPAIQILGKVVANGGGGGGGGEVQPGDPGADGTTAMHAVAALGGGAQPPNTGGTGGDGAALAIEAEGGGAPALAGTGGGGGGGGGTGIIWIKGLVSGDGPMSPAPALH
ncbi:MAG: hypothetical protein JNL83_01125 [Myxococcales bacterium]|nr:hypothetical protein [Myxococcales bacterium]